jgi:hypothetical protein
MMQNLATGAAVGMLVGGIARVVMSCPGGFGPIET